MISESTAGLVFYALALIALACLVGVWRRAVRVRTWQVVSGTVLSSSVASDSDANQYPQVRYGYLVNGREFVGDRILPFGRLASTGSYAEKVVDRYREGAAVNVYVNPLDPADSALERALPPIIPVMLVAAVAMCLVAGVVLRS